MTDNSTSMKTAKPPFVLNTVEPFSTFRNGESLQIPYVIDGLLIQGGFSILAGKPKQGKSSWARYAAVSVSKGAPFLDRSTKQGDVLLISQEDPLTHVDNCLKALGWNAATDSRILIAEHLSPVIGESIDAIGNALTKMPNARLVVIDTLAKFLRVKDNNDYSQVMEQVEKVHDLARRFPHLHVMGLAHCKKVTTALPFDSLLGSTALRGETDATLAVWEEPPNRLIAAEVRQGREIKPTIIQASLVDISGSNVVSNFALGQPLEDYHSRQHAKAHAKQEQTYEQRVIHYLQQNGNRALREVTLSKVSGNRDHLINAITTLADAQVLTITGKAQSPVDPLTLHLNQNSLNIHNYITQFRGTIQ